MASLYLFVHLEAGAHLVGGLVQDVAAACAPVLAVELAGDAQAVVLYREQHQLFVGQAEISVGWQAVCGFSIAGAVIHDDVRLDVDDSPEPGVALGRGDYHTELVGAASCASVINNVVSHKDSTSNLCDLAGAILLIVTVVAVIITITDEQVAHALVVVSTAVEVALTTYVTFELAHAVLQVVRMLDEGGPLGNYGVVPVVLELGHTTRNLLDSRFQSMQLAAAATRALSVRVVELADTFLLRGGDRGCVSRSYHCTREQQAPHV